MKSRFVWTLALLSVFVSCFIVQSAYFFNAVVYFCVEAVMCYMKRRRLPSELSFAH